MFWKATLNKFSPDYAPSSGWGRRFPGSAGLQPAWTARGLEARAPGRSTVPRRRRSREVHGPSKAAIQEVHGPAKAAAVPGIPCSQPGLRAQSGNLMREERRAGARSLYRTGFPCETFPPRLSNGRNTCPSWGFDSRIWAPSPGSHSLVPTFCLDKGFAVHTPTLRGRAGRGCASRSPAGTPARCEARSLPRTPGRRSAAKAEAPPRSGRSARRARSSR